MRPHPGITAKIIADSVWFATGHRERRITTVEVCYPRMILAEKNTHRDFSRNSASSRAIPLAQQIRAIENNMFVPAAFFRNISGMQGGEMLTGAEHDAAELNWRLAGESAISYAKVFDEMKVHKQHASRILEPYMWHTAVITSTTWGNFFSQRDNDAAQPEFHDLAHKMRHAINHSTPVERELHTPYVDDQDEAFWIQDGLDPDLAEDMRKIVSVVRCARVSYLRHNKDNPVKADLERFLSLISANPPHWSPLEHVATKAPDSQFSNVRVANFEGWRQLRHDFAGRSAAILTAKRLLTAMSQ